MRTPRAVAGIGLRRATAADEIVALVHRALEEAGLAAENLAAIATPADRAGEPAIREAAAAFGLIPTALGPAALAAADARVVTRSSRIEAMRGVGSVAEAAALAAAGPDARLLLARIASAGATCALAGPPPPRGGRAAFHGAKRLSRNARCADAPEGKRPRPGVS